MIAKIDTLFFLRFHLFIFRERRRKGEREGEKHQSVAFHMPPTRDLAHDPGMYRDWGPNWPPLGLQASTQSTRVTPARAKIGILF